MGPKRSRFSPSDQKIKADAEHVGHAGQDPKGRLGGGAFILGETISADPEGGGYFLLSVFAAQLYQPLREFLFESRGF